MSGNGPEGLEVPEARDMEALGAALALCLRGGERIYLEGVLGAGKTTLVRGLLRALGWQEAVRSPTYTLVESYALEAFPLHHFDLYRLADPSELEYLGVREYFSPPAVCLVEWPAHGARELPPADLRLELEVTGNGRVVYRRQASDRGQSLWDCLIQNLRKVRNLQCE